MPILGLDAGALAVKAVFKDTNGEIKSFYRFHKGKPEETISNIIDEIGERPFAAAVTGSNGKRIALRLCVPYVDPAVALIAAGDEFPGIRHIIDIGGASLSIVDLDSEGRFAGFRTNSLCAAGTGSFLDEQAARMKLSFEEMSKERAIDEPPRIAARCAVFAKSDLIHRQQAGFSIPEMWSGLCRGMVTTAVTTLFRGRKPAGPVLLAGGVAKNREVVRWLKKELPTQLVVPADPDTFSARGAIRAAKGEPRKMDRQSLLKTGVRESVPRRPRLELSMSAYPSFECRQSYIDDATEVRLHDDIGGDVVIGIDIGSTSTKAAVVGLEGKVMADFYRRTEGNPIGATQKVLASIARASNGATLSVKGAATTGSGRKMVGAIIGADRIINEITAHAKGAAATDPDVETIFEIGGQDAKFVSLREGVPHDSNMNYVCAAGTGSFVEEQAGKLGFELREIGDAVMGSLPPFSTDRCTVFMEQDVFALTRAGFDRREVMGSVLYSVVQNYLNKVVGRRPYSRKKICFMGATARNKGLIAAFEKLLNTKISVSPYCHVMGAYGVALIALEEVALKNVKTKFLGLSFANSSVTLNRSECKLCSNSCRITHALVDEAADDAPSWGYMCGRDPAETRMRVKNHFDAFRKRERLFRQAGLVKSLSEGAPQVGMPRALLTFSYIAFWRRFFGELGAKLVLSSPSGEKTLAAATDFIGSDYCYPVKLAHGHIRELCDDPKVNFIFLPYLVLGEPHDDNFKRSVFCPYNIALPSIVKECGICESKPIASPVINFQLDTNLITGELAKELAPVLKVNQKKIEDAWLKALESHREFSRSQENIGQEMLREIEAGGRKGVVILGRPYNVYDLGSNLNLPQKIADLDLTVLFVDMLPISDVQIDPLFRNTYWRYGRKILQAATFISNHPNLHAVFLTNFGCGPDSFLQTYVEKIMKGKPMLMLELDEHSADAGYITRLEAFRDVIGKSPSDRIVTRRTSHVTRSQSPVSEHSTNTLWIPPMHPYGTPLLAAALRSVGKNARPLPTETLETFEIAKRFCRGTECVPLPSTIGAFLSILKNSKDPSMESFLMPVADGPCRFGQYHTLHRIILDEAGYKTTEIEAWGDESSSYGTDMKTSRRCYSAIVAGDLLYKARCRIRPYARDKESFDSLMNELLENAVAAIEQNNDLRPVLRHASDRLLQVERLGEKRPLIGIVGEIYVRLNTFTNGNLIETIEDSGGEAWVAPLAEWFHYLSFLEKMRAREKNDPLSLRLKKKLKNAYMMRKERILTGCMQSVIGDRKEPPIESTLTAGESVFPRQFDGESILTVGRAIEFARNGTDLIVNCAPFGCMPGTLTSGIFQRLEAKLGVPIVSLFFDGETDLKPLVRTYLVNVKTGRNDEAGGEKIRNC